jgi:putative hydrolase of HD superfamily
VNVSRVIQMLLLHDVVEVDVGDTPIHGGHLPEQQALYEYKAAVRLFGLLPAAQGGQLMQLWQEFEGAETSDAKFAKALDRFQPLLVNVFTSGGTWRESRVSYEQVLQRYGPAIKAGAPELWAVCAQWVAEHFAS